MLANEDFGCRGNLMLDIRIDRMRENCVACEALSSVEYYHNQEQLSIGLFCFHYERTAHAKGPWSIWKRVNCTTRV